MGPDTPLPPDIAGTFNDVSKYARRYGITNEPFLGDQKSGLSPIDDDPSKAKDLEALVHLLESVRYQESQLLGFRTKLLEQFNALTGHGVGKSNLQAIHPMLQRDRWQTELPRHLAFYPVIAPGKTGFWKASNDDVWEVLEPVLALASKFIDHFHLWQWWDTLAFGRREVLDSESIPKIPENKPPLVRVVPRPAEVAAANREAVERARYQAGQKVVFGISSSWCWPLQGMSKGGTCHVGTSLRVWPGAPDQIVVHISFEELAPLMSSEMTDEERLMQQLVVAKTLVHELGHALGYTLFTGSGYREPYFADEPLIELGNSLINAILGGNNLSEILLNRKKWRHLREIPPFALIFRKGWPTFSNVWLRADENKPCLDKKITALNSEQTTFLLPLRWISDIQQEDYWDQQVNLYGVSAIQPEPLTVGFVETIKVDQEKIISRTSLMNLSWKGPYGPYNPYSGPFTEQEILARTDRIALAQEIADILSGVVHETIKRRKAIKKDTKDKSVTFSLKFSSSSESYKIPPGQARPPGTFIQILQVLQDNRQELAIDTMINWTPANLFLSYIYRLGQYQIPPIEFYDFLTACQAYEAYFEYDKTGNGHVRIRQGPPWLPFEPTKTPVECPSRHENFAYGLFRVKNHIHLSAGSNKDQLLCDIDTDHMYDVVRRHMRRITREYFENAMAYLDYIGGYYTCGPEGIYRLNTAVSPPEAPKPEKPKDPTKGSAQPESGPSTDTAARTSAEPSTAIATGTSVQTSAGPSAGHTPGTSTGPDPGSPLLRGSGTVEQAMGISSGKKHGIGDDSTNDSWDDQVSDFVGPPQSPDTDEDKPRRKKQRT